MKKKFYYVLLFLTIPVCFLSCSRTYEAKQNSVNQLLGDISFVKKFGQKPDPKTEENLRIRTHLEYVENLLRKRDISQLEPELQENRRQMLDLLHFYWNEGVFPRNYDYQNERKPCFIDKDGRICAVGYLVEHTAGKVVAEAINDKYKYEALLAMNDPLLDDWITQCGLTKEECAMIQPTYGSYPVYVYDDYNHISAGYGVPSAILGGLSLSLNVLNGVQIAQGTRHKVTPMLGLVTGASQITLGLIKYPKEEVNDYGRTYVNKGERNLSLLNIGLGTTTILLSSWNLLTPKTKKENTLSWNVYSYPAQGSQLGLGVYLSKTF